MKLKWRRIKPGWYEGWLGDSCVCDIERGPWFWYWRAGVDQDGMAWILATAKREAEAAIGGAR